jgi:hypothetical protein
MCTQGVVVISMLPTYVSKQEPQILLLKSVVKRLIDLQSTIDPSSDDFNSDDTAPMPSTYEINEVG